MLNSSGAAIVGKDDTTAATIVVPRAQSRGHITCRLSSRRETAIGGLGETALAFSGARLHHLVVPDLSAPG